MPLLSVSNATVTELFKGNAKFCRPSTKKGEGWVATSDNGNAIIQKQINKDGAIVFVVRFTNYMGADGLNGRIIPELPILRGKNSKEVYFKTSSTTTSGSRYKAPFLLKFETVDKAEEFEMWWLMLNGSIVAWKEEDAKKKEGGKKSNSNNIAPLQDSTNAESNPVRNAKRKAGPMIGGPLQKKKYSLNCIDVGIDRSNNVENQAVLLRHDGSADDSVCAFKAVGSMPTEVNSNGKVRKIVKVKRSILKSITESLIDNRNLNGEDGADLKNNNGEDSNYDSDDGYNNDNNYDSSNHSSSEDVIVDEEDAPQSQNWSTAFASY